MTSTPSNRTTPIASMPHDELSSVLQRLSEIEQTQTAIRHQLASLASRLSTIEQTAAVAATKKESKNLTPASFPHTPNSTRSQHPLAILTTKAEEANLRIDSTQTMLKQSIAALSNEITATNTKLASILHLLETDPYKITKAKLIRIAKELKLE